MVIDHDDADDLTQKPSLRLGVASKTSKANHNSTLGFIALLPTNV
jgi:hypothetical protein